MAKLHKELFFNGKEYKNGEEFEDPTQRMFDLGFVAYNEPTVSTPNDGKSTESDSETEEKPVEKLTTPPVEEEKSTTPPVEEEKSTTPPVEEEKPTTPPVEEEKPTTPPVEEVQADSLKSRMKK